MSWTPELSGPYQHDVRASDVAWFQQCVSRATSFSLGLADARSRVLATPGIKVRRHVAPFFAELLPANVIDMYSVHTWFGISQRNALVVRVELDKRYRSLFAKAETPFWSVGRWEDLALFRENKVLMWTTTHDSKGVGYGERDELLKLGLQPKAAEPRAARFEPLDSQCRVDILKLAETGA